MSREDIIILSASEVSEVLKGRETEILETVQAAYEAHAVGASTLPHSSFLHFPDEPKNRIIALPAYLGEGFEVAGIKWIASFPGNREVGLERASAVVIVNSARTGQPRAILEGSIISAKRTAASAALAARHLHIGERVISVGLIGCGVINREIARFLRIVFPDISMLAIYDSSVPNAEYFREQCAAHLPGIDVVIGRDVNDIFENASLVSLATTAAEPHIFDLSACAPGSTLLHISLRDLAPQIILSHDNIVDDPDHVCRARTSVHLAEQLIGHRRFIRCTLADITRGLAPARNTPDDIALFSPFGLGVLDLAISKLVLDRAEVTGLGSVIRSFLPTVAREEDPGLQGNPTAAPRNREPVVVTR